MTWLRSDDFLQNVESESVFSVQPIMASCWMVVIYSNIFLRLFHDNACAIQVFFKKNKWLIAWFLPKNPYLVPFKVSLKLVYGYKQTFFMKNKSDHLRMKHFCHDLISFSFIFKIQNELLLFCPIENNEKKVFHATCALYSKFSEVIRLKFLLW